jgi:hypothetical protein
MNRCVETAAPLSSMLGLPIRLEWGFSENIERGSIADHEVPLVPTPSEHKQRFPLVDDTYVSLFPRDQLRKGGEERPDVVRRTKFALERILANTTGNIAVFTHGGPVEKVTSSLVIDKTFEPSFCGMTRIRVSYIGSFYSIYRIADCWLMMGRWMLHERISWRYNVLRCMSNKNLVCVNEFVYVDPNVVDIELMTMLYLLTLLMLNHLLRRDPCRSLWHLPDLLDHHQQELHQL